jgi:PhzF family phenazine biosynthesis protein
MTTRPFQQVDVFSATPYRGNPLAVVLDGTGLSDAQMQQFAAWTNLSETTFVLPPAPEAAAAGADYQVRIFTTAYEMPFAGHPTLGTCHAWLTHGGVPKDPARIVQQCKVGLVAIQRQGTRLAFAAPRLQRSAPVDALWQALPQALGLAPAQVRAAQHLRNGPSHFGVLLDSAESVLAVQPDLSKLQGLMAEYGFTGLGVAARRDNDADTEAPLIRRSNREARAFGGGAEASQAEPDLEVRFFFDRGNGVGEDPITGSFNASLAQWLIAEGHAPQSYLAAQGTCIGREGRVHIAQDAQGQVWVGGNSVTCVQGQVNI